MSTRYVWEKYNILQNQIIFSEIHDIISSASRNSYSAVVCDEYKFVFNGNDVYIEPYNASSVYHSSISGSSDFRKVESIPARNMACFGFPLAYGYPIELSIYSPGGSDVLFRIIPGYEDGEQVYLKEYKTTNVQELSVGDVKDSLIGNISNIDETKYPTDAISGNYWYTYKGSDSIDPVSVSIPTSIDGGDRITISVTESDSNTYGGTITYQYQVSLNGSSSWTTLTSTTPSSISVPSSVQAGKAFTVSWGASTDADSNLSGYTLQRKLNSGAYTTIYTGSSRSYQDTIPKSGYTSVTYRVQAYDTDGATSSYKTSSTVTVINNVAPVISGSDSNLGTFTYNPPIISYSITDSNNDAVTATIKLNSSIIETKNISLGQTYTVSIDWWNIDAGSHTLTITATDGKGGTATRKYTFNKKSVGLISFNRLRKKTDTGYQTTYIETDSDSIITNNGQILSERLTNIASKLSISIDTTLSEMVLRHRLHIKLTSEYTIDYLEIYSTNVKVGTNTLESILTQLESKVGISNGGTVPSNLNFERWRIKNSSGGYDIIYLEGVSEHIICPCGKSVEERLVAIEAKI